LALSVRVDKTYLPSFGALSKEPGRGSNSPTGRRTGDGLCPQPVSCGDACALGAAPMSRAAVVALSLAGSAVDRLCRCRRPVRRRGGRVWRGHLVILYGPTAPGGSDLGTGFTDRTTSPRQARPTIVCRLLGPRALPGVRGAMGRLRGRLLRRDLTRHRTANGTSHPFRITRAESLTAPFGQNALTCPGSSYLLRASARTRRNCRSSPNRPTVAFTGSRSLSPFKQPEPLNSYRHPRLCRPLQCRRMRAFSLFRRARGEPWNGALVGEQDFYSSLPVPELAAKEY